MSSFSYRDAYRAFDARVEAVFSRYPVLAQHDSPGSRVLTVVVLAIFVFVLTRELGIRFGLLEDPGKAVFKEIPVHCAHLRARVNVVLAARPQGVYAKPVVYAIEFGPEDFDEKHNEDPEFGMGLTLGHLRAKVLGLFADSSLALDPDVAEVRLYSEKDIHRVEIRHRGKVLPPSANHEHLCLLGVETGHLVDATISV